MFFRAGAPSMAHRHRAGPGELSHGQKQWLEIGMLLVWRTQVSRSTGRAGCRDDRSETADTAASRDIAAEREAPLLWWDTTGDGL